MLVNVFFIKYAFTQLMMMYNIGSFKNVDQFLMMIAKKYGKLKKGGRPNVNQAAKQILNDWIRLVLFYIYKIVFFSSVTNSYQIGSNYSL